MESINSLNASWGDIIARIVRDKQGQKRLKEEDEEYRIAAAVAWKEETMHLLIEIMRSAAKTQQSLVLLRNVAGHLDSRIGPWPEYCLQPKDSTKSKFVLLSCDVGSPFRVDIRTDVTGHCRAFNLSDIESMAAPYLIDKISDMLV